MAKLTREKRDQLILTALMSSMIMVALWMLLISPTRVALAKMAGEVGVTEDQLTDARRVVSRAGQIEVEMKATAFFLAAMERDMVEGDPNLWIRSILNDFFGQSKRGVELPSIGTPDLGEIGVLPDFPYKAMFFRLSGKGFYHDIGKFIADFENRYPYIRVQNLDLKPSGNAERFGPSGETLAYSFEIVVPVKPEEKEKKS